MRKWWPLYAALMGFAVGASFFFGLYGRNVTESEIASQEKHYAPAEKSEPNKQETDAALAYYTLWLMTFTGVLAFATIALGIGTLMLYATGEKQFKFAIRSSIRQSREMRASIETARAGTDIANKEFIATHRPRIIVRLIQGPFDDGQEPQFVWATLVNVGETDAKIVAIGKDLARRKGRNGWLPPGVAAGLRDIDPITLVSGERMVVKVHAQEVTSERMIANTAWDDSELCAVGQVRYEDGNGVPREMAFLRVHDGDGNFIPSKNTEDEYQD